MEIIEKHISCMGNGNTVNYRAIFCYKENKYAIGLLSDRSFTGGSVLPVTTDGEPNCEVEGYQIDLPFGFGADNISEDFMIDQIKMFCEYLDENPESVEEMMSRQI